MCDCEPEDKCRVQHRTDEHAVSPAGPVDDVLRREFADGYDARRDAVQQRDLCEREIAGDQKQGEHRPEEANVRIP